MDHVVATSARSGSFLDVPHDVIMHGIDTAAFHPPQDAQDRFGASGSPGAYAVGCAGRIRHQKGTDLFVEAMIALLPLYPDWTAVITGRTTSEHQSFERDLKRSIDAAGLGERIRFLGEVPDMKLWYRRFSLFVAPSRNEGFGLTPLEAMASETAVVTSDAGAYAEMVTPETGVVTPAGDLAALTAAIETFMRDPQAAISMGLTGRKHIEINFPLEREAAALNAMYRKLIQ
jgi:mannosyltransferase